VLGHPEWADDERFATQYDWLERMDDTLRPAIEGWAADKTRGEACAALAAAGLAAGPVLRDAEIVADPHIEARDMAVAMPRTDGVHQPVLIPGNPVRMSKVAMGPETRVPWLGEHTDEVLAAELGLDDAARADLRSRGVIA
jgi:formyl-CoA transferase